MDRESAYEWGEYNDNGPGIGVVSGGQASFRRTPETIIRVHTRRSSIATTVLTPWQDCVSLRPLLLVLPETMLPPVTLLPFVTLAAAQVAESCTVLFSVGRAKYMTWARIGQMSQHAGGNLPLRKHVYIY